MKGVVTLESSIISLDEHTDQATKQMLQHVIDRKRKYESFKSKASNDYVVCKWNSHSICCLSIFIHIDSVFIFIFYNIFSLCQSDVPCIFFD